MNNPVPIKITPWLGHEELMVAPVTFIAYLRNGWIHKIDEREGRFRIVIYAITSAGRRALEKVVTSVETKCLGLGPSHTFRTRDAKKRRFCAKCRPSRATKRRAVVSNAFASCNEELPYL